MQDIVNTLSLIGSSIAGFLFLLLLTLRNPQTYANRLLSPFVLTFCLALFQSHLQSSVILHGLLTFKLATACLYFLAAPSLYGYARYMFKQQELTKKDLPHLFPFLMILTGALTTIIWPKLIEGFWWIQQPLLYIQLAIYCIMVWRMVERERILALNEYSDYQRTHLIWISALCISVMMLIVLDTVMGVAIYFLQLEAPMAHNMMMSVIAFLIVGLTFYSLRQPLIIHGEPNTSDASEPTTEKDKKYQKSSLSDSQASYYHEKLIQQMASEKHHLDNALTLTKLAQRLNLSRHHLSQVINDNMNTSFYDYINGLRVEEAQSLLVNERLSVTEVCFASGFANKATFNNAFKKFTSQTPTQWRKNKKAA